LKHASAADVARKINEFFPLGGAGRLRGGSPDMGSPNPSAGGGVVQKVVADERTNSIILNGSDAGIDKVKKFIDQIDIAVEGGGGLIHVYALQNVKAEDISQTLSALTSGASKRRSSSGNNTSYPPMGGIPPPPLPTNTGEQTVASLLNGDVKITSDQATNSLVIQASQRDFDVLKSIIKKLDIRRRQVFIESAILETTVSNSNSFGTQYSGPFARTSKLQSSDPQPIKSGGILSVGDAGTSLEALLKNPTSLTGLALGFRSGGSVSVKQADGTIVNVPLMSAVLRASATNSNINLLSTPHILATANEEANIVIGTEIPQISQETSTTGGNPLVNYTRIPIAKELSITPQINSGDYITLKIKQKVNEVGDPDPRGQYTTKKREASTTAIVKDSQTIVIGGLMEDRDTIKIDKVPLLGDIPILGWLFKSRTKSTEKVNFLLFITPHIIRDTADMNDTFFRKLKERQGILKELGINEKKNIPVSGLTEEQLKLLDDEYVKSLQLVPIRSHTEIKEENPADTDLNTPSSNLPAPSQIMPAPEQKTEVPMGQPQIQTPASPTPAPSSPLPMPAPMPVPEAPKSERPMQLEDAPPEELTPTPDAGKNKTI
jgi:general secretion pathway protein D